jgi:phosphate transport system permease protein
MMSSDGRIFRDGLSRKLLAFGAVLTVLTTVIVLFQMLKEVVQFFALVPWTEFLFTTKWEPLIEPKSFGVWPLVSGTLMVGLGAMLIAVPLGVLVAVFLSEYAGRVGQFRVREILKPVLEILAGVPTVVYGYFALTFVTPALRHVVPEIRVFNALSATIVVAVMVLPMIASLVDDALQALPSSLREGGYALGGTSAEVITLVLLPASVGRILAAILLAFSRAVGETMAVVLAAGATPRLEWNFLESIQTMTAYIVQVSLGDTQAGGVEYLSAFAVGFSVFMLTLILNGIGGYAIVRSGKELQ